MRFGRNMLWIGVVFFLMLSCSTNQITGPIGESEEQQLNKPILPGVVGPAEPEPGIDYQQIRQKWINALDQATNKWQLMFMGGGTINGPTCTFYPGLFRELISFKTLLINNYQLDGCSSIESSIFTSIADAIQFNYSQFVEYGLQGSLNIFPNFANYPARYAYGSSVEFSLISMNSGSAVSANDIYSMAYNQSYSMSSEYRSLIQDIADYACFRLVWYRCHTYCILIGYGPVPSYCPPYVLCGPVRGGTVQGGSITYQK